MALDGSCLGAVSSSVWLSYSSDLATNTGIVSFPHLRLYLLVTFSYQRSTVIIVIGLLGGTGSCLVHTTCYASIGQWFEGNRATASGFAATGSSVGGVMFILTLQSLFDRIGFGWSTRVMGFIMLFCKV